MSYPVAGVSSECGCGKVANVGGVSAAAFALVLFVLLVIILKAGTGIC